MTKNYNLHKNFLECETLSLEYSKVAEHERSVKKMEKMGIDAEDEENELYPDTTRAVLNLTALGEITFFNETEVQISEKDNFVKASFLEFKSGFEIVVLIAFEEFKQIYYDYLEKV